jgi:hypothetical protein
MAAGSRHGREAPAVVSVCRVSVPRTRRPRYRGRVGCARAIVARIRLDVDLLHPFARCGVRSGARNLAIRGARATCGARRQRNPDRTLLRARRCAIASGLYAKDWIKRPICEGCGLTSYRDGVASGWIYGQAVHNVHINELAHALERDDGVIVSAAKSGN